MIVNGLLGDCLRIAFGLQTTRLCIARGLSWDCLRIASGLQTTCLCIARVCLGIVQRLPWDCLGSNGSRNIAQVMFWGMLVGVSWDCLATAKEFEVT